MSLKAQGYFEFIIRGCKSPKKQEIYSRRVSNFILLFFISVYYSRLSPFNGLFYKFINTSFSVLMNCCLLNLKISVKIISILKITLNLLHFHSNFHAKINFSFLSILEYKKQNVSFSLLSIPINI